MENSKYISKRDYATRYFKSQEALKKANKKIIHLQTISGVCCLIAGAAIVTLIFAIRMRGWA